MVSAKGVAEDLVVATFDGCSGHDRDWCAERRRQEEVRLHVLATEDQNPKEDRCEAGAARKRGVRSGECLRGHVLPGLSGNPISEHATGGNNGECDSGDD